MSEIKKAGLGDYGVGAVLTAVNSRSVGVLIGMFQQAIMVVITQLLKQKELHAGDRIDIRIYVTRANSN